MESTSITAFAPGCASTIEGDGTSNGNAVHFVMKVLDQGEPARNRDTFEIHVTDSTGTMPVYNTPQEFLGSGNIQADGTVDGGRVLGHGQSCSP
jgi:hypothetical protein